MIRTKGETNERAGDIKGALLHYREAIDLYNGDFLPEDLYVPPIERKREELRRKYLDLLFKTARIYEYRRALSKAISYYRRAIQTDPLLESACQRLMILLSDKGKRNEALRVYEECKKALKNEIDSEPEQLTTAIYSKILG